jgi:hypothetical protein
MEKVMTPLPVRQRGFHSLNLQYSFPSDKQKTVFEKIAIKQLFLKALKY